ncbi:MAG: hypothetical protein PHF63_00655 [Herbinix sp.]|nr:hypothetical protein [Herbinix sp.]
MKIMLNEIEANLIVKTVSSFIEAATDDDVVGELDLSQAACDKFNNSQKIVAMKNTNGAIELEITTEFLIDLDKVLIRKLVSLVKILRTCVEGMIGSVDFHEFLKKWKGERPEEKQIKAKSKKAKE